MEAAAQSEKAKSEEVAAQPLRLSEAYGAVEEAAPVGSAAPPTPAHSGLVLFVLLLVEVPAAFGWKPGRGILGNRWKRRDALGSDVAWSTTQSRGIEVVCERL